MKLITGVMTLLVASALFVQDPATSPQDTGHAEVLVELVGKADLIVLGRITGFRDLSHRDESA